MQRHRSTWKTAAGAAGFLCLMPSSAAAWGEDLYLSVGLGVSFSFGTEVPRAGITFDARLAQILHPEVLDTCTRLRRTGLGVFVQGTWMGGPSRLAAGLHGGGEFGERAPFGTLEGELGWTWRSAWGGESAGHGLHFGLLVARSFVDASARLVLTPEAREADLEGIISVGLRFPTPLGESWSVCMEGRSQRIDDTVVLPNAWAVVRAEGSRAAGLAWLDAARNERASVPAFLDLAHELGALGAPERLIRATHHAAIEELRHTALCRGLASEVLGGPVGVGPVSGIPRRPELERLVVESYRDGVIGEGAAARRAAFAAEAPGVEDRVQRVSRQIAHDEARHAELAWEVIRWAIEERPSLRDVLSAEMRRESVPHLDAVEDGERFGRPCPTRVADAHDAAMRAGRRHGRQLI